MSSSPYEGEGGVGGKFRRRPFRRSTAASTPYDRPPAADRASRLNREGNGWISRLVDPASRIIAAGASRFFTSVFTKRLLPPATTTAAPPLSPSAAAAAAAASPIHRDGKLIDDPQFRENGSNAIPVNSFEMKPEGIATIESAINKVDRVAISELEQLVKQKTFTRAESDRLTELLRSRTIDLSMEDEIGKLEPSTSKEATQFGMRETDILCQQQCIREPKLLGSISKPAASIDGGIIKVPEEEIASPTELAKAFMGSRVLNLSPPASGLQYLPHRDVSTLSVTRRTSNVPVAPRSIIHFSGLDDNGYRTPMPKGRSAIYKMSRSPYFRSQHIVSSQGHDPSREGNVEQGQQAPPISSAKQVLKRRSLFIENDSGSFGPIRRIRQKSNMTSLKNNSSSGRVVSARTSNGQVPTSSALRHHLPNGLADHTSVMEDAVDGFDKDAHENFASVPQQSSVMARKILQQLDHLVPSPKEKVSSVQKSVINDESPSKLTFNMLNGQARNSVKDIDSSKLYDVESNHSVTNSSGFLKHKSEAPISQMHDRLESSFPSNTSTSGVKVSSEAGVSDSMAASASNTENVTTVNRRPGIPGAKLVSSGASDIPKKPSFSMKAPENTWELEADAYVGGNASDLASTGKETSKSSITLEKSLAETTLKKPLLSSSENENPKNKVFNESVTFNKGNDFKFDSDGQCTSLSHAPTSSQASSMSGKPILLKEQSSSPQKSQALSPSTIGCEQATSTLGALKPKDLAPLFTFDSKNSSVLTFSQSASNVIDSSSLKFGAKSDQKVEMTGSMSMIATSQSETPGSDEGKEAELVGSSKSFGIPLLSGSAMSAVSSAFCAPDTSSQSNVFLKSSEPVSVAPFTPLFGKHEALTMSSFSKQSTSASVLSPVPSHQEIFGTTALSTESTMTATVKGKSEELESKGSKGSPFVPVAFSAPVAVPASSSGSSLSDFSFPAHSARSSQGHPLSAQPTQFGSGSSIFTHNLSCQFGSSSSTAGLGSSVVASSSSAFGSLMAGVKPFSFGLSSEPGQSSATSFTASAIATSSLSSAAPMTTASLFNSSQLSSSSIFGSGFASGSSSLGIPFGAQPISSGTSIPFGAASLPAFSFSSVASNSTSAAASPMTGFGTPALTFGSSSAGNEQMSVEDSMTDDAVQTAMPAAPTFGQTTNPSTPLNFGSPVVQPGGSMGFQFGSQAAPAFQAQHPFQASGNLEFAAGGSFSLGSGGGDKSNRRIVKVKRTTKGRK